MVCGQRNGECALLTKEQKFKSWHTLNTLKQVVLKAYNKDLKREARTMAITTDKEKFSRREWFFAIALIMMIEYWIVSISYRFVDYQQVVNFISFGASIASILLAIVAIIHGFIQSDSGTKTSAKLQNQADEIKESTGTLNTSTKAIESHIKKVVAVTERLDNLDLNIKDSINKVSGLQSTVDSMHTDYRELLRAATQKENNTPNTKEQSESNITSIDIIKTILSRCSFDADLLGYALYKYSESGKQMSLIDFHNNYYAVAADETRQLAYLNLSINLCAILRSVNAIEYSSLGGQLVISETLKSALPDITADAKESSHEKISKGIKLIDEAAATLKDQS